MSYPAKFGMLTARIFLTKYSAIYFSLKVLSGPVRFIVYLPHTLMEIHGQDETVA